MCSLIVRTPASKDVARLVGRELAAACVSAAARLRQAPLELALEKLDLARTRTDRARCRSSSGRDARVRDDQDPVLDVIERQHGIEQHEPGLVFVGRPRRRVRAPARSATSAGSKLGERVVADEADGAAREARQAGNERRSGIRPCSRREGGRRTRPSRRSSRRTGRSSSCPAARPQDEERILAEEGVARDAARRPRRSRSRNA